MYTNFYKLKEEPFRLTPDPRYFHLADTHRAVLETLLRGVLTHKGFILLTGPVGTGKTTLLHAARQILSDKSLTKAELLSALVVNPLLTRDEFFEILLDAFKVPCTSTSKPQRLMALQQRFLDAQQGGATAVLMLDEAHLLPPQLLEEVRLLNNAHGYQGTLLQIVLCGQPELVTLLTRPENHALRQRIACTGHLRPLNLPETRAYIAERLHIAGLRGPSPFSGTAVESIYNYTGGVPRAINLLCDFCLWLGLRNQTKHVGPAQVEEAYAELGVGTLDAPDVSQPMKGSGPARQSSSAETVIDKLMRAMSKRSGGSKS